MTLRTKRPSCQYKTIFEVVLLNNHMQVSHCYKHGPLSGRNVNALVNPRKGSSGSMHYRLYTRLFPVKSRPALTRESMRKTWQKLSLQPPYPKNGLKWRCSVAPRLRVIILGCFTLKVIGSTRTLLRPLPIWKKLRMWDMGRRQELLQSLTTSEAHCPLT
jgi:hypothetical protein